LPRNDPPLVVSVPKPIREPRPSSMQFGFRLGDLPQAKVTTARPSPANLLSRAVSHAAPILATPAQATQNRPGTLGPVVHSEPTGRYLTNGDIDPRRVARVNYDSHNLDPREGEQSRPNGLTGSHVTPAAYLGPPEDMDGNDYEDDEDDAGNADYEGENEGGGEEGEGEGSGEKGEGEGSGEEGKGKGSSEEGKGKGGGEEGKGKGGGEEDMNAWASQEGGSPLFL
jgi:hypothetical protein